MCSAGSNRNRKTWNSEPSLVEKKGWRCAVCDFLQVQENTIVSMVRTNSTLDDVAAVIGFTATLRLVAWYGGVNSNLYVPETASADHQIARLIGAQALQRLVDEWGKKHLNMPTLNSYYEDCRTRVVKEGLERGQSTRSIAEATGLTERRVQQIRMALEVNGLLPMVLGKKVPEKAP